MQVKIAVHDKSCAEYLEAIDTPKTVRQVANKLQLPMLRVRSSLNILVDLKVAVLEDGRYHRAG